MTAGVTQPESGVVLIVDDDNFWSILAQTAAEVPSIIDWAVTALDVAPAVGMGGISMGGALPS